MTTNRRRFLASALISGVGAALPLASKAGSFFENRKPGYANPNYETLDAILKQPVLRRELFPSPVIIETIELLQDRNNFLCRVRSKDGAVGLSVGHPFISKQGYPMFNSIVAPAFQGKDARDLDTLIDSVCQRNAKAQGVPLCVQAATIEFAILDMLGNIAKKPIGELLGKIHHPRIAVYQGSRYRELRSMPPEQSLDLVKQDLQESKAKAIKIRAGKGDNLGRDNDNAPGRTEKLIAMARKEFGDKMVLMIDGNGSYNVREAIRIGKILQEHKFHFYEEPIPWDWYEEQKQVNDALQIPMAGGEEEFSMHRFRWIIANNALDIVQPDQFYFGGMIRSIKVARMAAAFGKTFVPHMSDGGLGYLYMLHCVSAVANAGPYHEFKLFATLDGNGNEVPFQSKTQPITSEDGVVKVPTGPGLGIIIDPAYIKTHKPISA